MASDSFTGTNGAAPSGWTNTIGPAWEIFNNAVRPTGSFGSCLLRREETNFPNDQYLKIDLQFSNAPADAPRNFGSCRTDGSGGGYHTEIAPSGISLLKGPSGTYLTDTPIGGLTANTLYPVKIEAIGSTIKVYVDTGGGLVERISFVDTSYTSGRPALRCVTGDSANTQVFDNAEWTDPIVGSEILRPNNLRPRIFAPGHAR